MAAVVPGPQSEAHLIAWPEICSGSTPRLPTADPRPVSTASGELLFFRLSATVHVIRQMNLTVFSPAGKSRLPSERTTDRPWTPAMVNGYLV